MRTALALLSVVLSAAIWAIYIRPLETEPLYSFNDLDYLLLTVFLIPVAGIAVVLVATSWSKRLATLIVTALAVPAVLAVVAFGHRDELRWQREAHEVFDRYTHRFPDDELGQARIMRQYGDLLVVCAAQRSRRPTDFCVETDVSLPRNNEVVGGSRYHPDELHPDYGFISANPYDCFGEALGCE